MFKPVEFTLIDEEYSQSIDEILIEHKLEKYIPLFKKHDISSDILHLLTEDDLRAMGIPTLGDIKRIFRMIQQLGKSQNIDVTPRSPESPKKRSRSVTKNGSFSLSTKTSALPTKMLSSNYIPGLLVEEGIVPVLGVTHGRFFDRFFKMLLSICFLFMSMVATSLTMVCCHERVPDAVKHPPLPDLVLDNLPLIPWAFEASEIFIFILAVMIFLIFAFHQHRMIVIRRVALITGILFLMRCVTMIGTSLSVPGTHLDCKTAPPRSLDEKFQRAYEIASGFGASVAGVQTCGDYMFSGHTIMLTVLSSFVEFYTPWRWKLLHVITTLLNVFGCFLVLAAHEHYTIDVVIAFFLSKTIFQGYHESAALQSIIVSDDNNPLSGTLFFSFLHFFEGECQGVIANEYESPCQAIRHSTALTEMKQFFSVLWSSKRRSQLLESKSVSAKKEM